MKAAKILARRSSEVLARAKGGATAAATLGLLTYSTSFAQFTGTELDASTPVVTGLLGAGALACIAFAVYTIGKRATSKV
jgi:hypothetical protein